MPHLFRTLRLIATLALAALLLAPTEFASAQRYGPPGGGGFFNYLFGRPPVPQPPQPVRPRAPAPAVAAPPPAKPAVAKDPQGRKILVVGDFVGGVVAAGLERTFAEEAKVRVIDRTNANSGLARQTNYDWVKQLPVILTAERPDIVVMAVGANDRQALTGSSQAQWGTNDWAFGYRDRVTAVAAAITASGASFFWVGTVPMRSTPEADMALLNDLVRPQVEMAGGFFVDVWDGFTDDDGHLVISGPDVDGQTRPLRTANGINFTDAGQAKLAFYVAREIRRRTGVSAGAVDLTASLSQTGRVEVGSDGRRRVIGPVISLNEPQPGAAINLAGESKGAGAAPLLAAPKDAASPQGVLISGAALPPVTGRADDFRWPR